MMVRCGACRNQFDVPGAGRYACPVCGSVNVVRDAAGGPPPQGNPYQTAPDQVSVPGQAPGQPFVPSAPPPPKIECPECAFTFYVGSIALATCPNCGAEVETGLGEAQEEPAEA
jgi:predicted RNA-binding Zn-ribbon protein involved in translation (DUF1610 family)